MSITLCIEKSKEWMSNVVLALDETQESKIDLAEAFTKFVAHYENVFRLKEEWTDEDAELVLKIVVKNILADSWSPQLAKLALAATKVITRARRSLDGLVNSDFLLKLLSFADPIVSSENKSNANHHIAAVEALGVLTNLSVIKQEEMKKFYNDFNVFPTMIALFESAEDIAVKQLFARLFFFVCIDNQTALKFIDKYHAHNFLTTAFLKHSADFKPTDKPVVKLLSEIAKAFYCLGMDSVRPSITTKIPQDDYKLLAARIVDLLSIKENDADIISMKQDLGNMMLTLPQHLAPELMAKIDALNGLLEVLEHQANVKTDPQSALSPILLLLTNIMKNSPDARKHIKRYIFKADADAVEEKRTSEAPVNMEPSEKDVVVDHTTLRGKLTNHITTLHYTLKQAVSEFLFVACDSNSDEYIRLCGFGRAVGLLAEKGLPGFTMLRQQQLGH